MDISCRPRRQLPVYASAAWQRHVLCEAQHFALGRHQSSTCRHAAALTPTACGLGALPAVRGCSACSAIPKNIRPVVAGPARCPAGLGCAACGARGSGGCLLGAHAGPWQPGAQPKRTAVRAHPHPRPAAAAGDAAVAGCAGGRCGRVAAPAAVRLGALGAPFFCLYVQNPALALTLSPNILLQLGLCVLINDVW